MQTKMGIADVALGKARETKRKLKCFCRCSGVFVAVCGILLIVGAVLVGINAEYIGTTDGKRFVVHSMISYCNLFHSNTHSGIAYAGIGLASLGGIGLIIAIVVLVVTYRWLRKLRNPIG